MEARKVSVIPAGIKNENGQPVKSTKKLKVAAYCRVSTDHEEQQNSYTAQKSHYKELIEKNTNWKFAGIFADEGISGTNTKNRTDFNNMIEACKNGKIDLIITKCISRFARNTVDCLTYIRLLKELNIPVIFEKENINTMDSVGEFVITLLGSLAQEESRNISTNIKWSIEKQFEKGIMRVPRLFGYDKDENGDLVINPVTSKVVKKIFTLYANGESIQRIIDNLRNSEIKSPMGNELWSKRTIKSLLTNEKYCGDAILQKYYRPDFLTGKSKINNGEVKKYFVEGSHPGIISKEIFNMVQEELKRRSTIEKKSEKCKKSTTGKYSSKYALTEILECAECGKPYRRQIWSAYETPRTVWRCFNRLEYGKKNCKHSPTLDEQNIEIAVTKAIQHLLKDKDELLETMKTNVTKALEKRNKTKVTANTNNDGEIEQLKQALFKMMEEDAASDTIGNYEDRYTEITTQIKALQNKKTSYSKEQMNIDTMQLKFYELENTLNNLTNGTLHYDNIVVRDMIEKVVVVSKEKIIVKFKVGYEREESLIE